MASTKIPLPDHFAYGHLLKFTVPSIVMMIFTSIYGVVSAVISLIRTLVCQIVAAELAALVLTGFCIIKFRKRYHYL